MLSYLLSRLTQAQGFTTHLPHPAGRTSDPQDILAHARKQARVAKGAHFDIVLHRYYGKHPQEGSSSVWVTLPIQFRNNSLELIPGRDLEVKQPSHPQWGWEIHTVPAQRSYRGTWLALLATIEQIRAPRNHAA
jgi:hypothetical protein